MDAPTFPPGWEQLLTFAKAMVQFHAHGGHYLPLPMAEERLAICTGDGTKSKCDQYAPEGRCQACGCWLRQIPKTWFLNAGQPGKIFMPHQQCPHAKWGPRPDDGLEMTEAEVAAMLAKPQSV